MSPAMGGTRSVTIPIGHLSPFMGAKQAFDLLGIRFPWPGAHSRWAHLSLWATHRPVGPRPLRLTWEAEGVQITTYRAVRSADDTLTVELCADQRFQEDALPRSRGEEQDSTLRSENIKRIVVDFNRRPTLVAVGPGRAMGRVRPVEMVLSRGNRERRHEETIRRYFRELIPDVDVSFRQVEESNFLDPYVASIVCFDQENDPVMDTGYSQLGDKDFPLTSLGEEEDWRVERFQLELDVSAYAPEIIGAIVADIDNNLEHSEWANVGTFWAPGYPLLLSALSAEWTEDTLTRAFEALLNRAKPLRESMSSTTRSTASEGGSPPIGTRGGIKVGS